VTGAERAEPCDPSTGCSFTSTDRDALIAAVADEPRNGCRAVVEIEYEIADPAGRKRSDDTPHERFPVDRHGGLRTNIRQRLQSGPQPCRQQERARRPPVSFRHPIRRTPCAGR
jgi:hypothetical protein